MPLSAPIVMIVEGYFGPTKTLVLWLILAKVSMAKVPCPKNQDSSASISIICGNGHRASPPPYNRTSSMINSNKVINGGH